MFYDVNFSTFSNQAIEECPKKKISKNFEEKGTVCVEEVIRYKL